MTLMDSEWVTIKFIKLNLGFTLLRSEKTCMHSLSPNYLLLKNIKLNINMIKNNKIKNKNNSKNSKKNKKQIITEM